jgi:PncC family amidohydrolase
VNVPGASEWFRGGVVAYHEQVKFDVLGVPVGPVVSEKAALAMAEGVRRVTGSDVGLGITGVAGPDEQEGAPPGTIFIGISLPGGVTSTRELHMVGDRERVRQYGTISTLDLLCPEGPADLLSARPRRRGCCTHALPHRGPTAGPHTASKPW